jgi:hypothetical protein
MVLILSWLGMLEKKEHIAVKPYALESDAGVRNSAEI